MSYQRRKILKALKKLGFDVIREGGKHTIFANAQDDRIAVPRHNEIKRGTARGIAADAGADWSDFEREIT
ncbi:type II toxin-antitoxin system HicA family toxin [Botrimarina sp.]|uniref:type II toxin-antitoxin system HicA family toxin n=1 Tax=Botrimarina sp. TaxID=2795802 RepID=UPI0032EF44CC